MEVSEPSSANAFDRLIRNGFSFRMFLLKNLPSAYFSGLRIRELSPTSCTVSVPFKWFTRNPFRSTYFACLSMAAEMSTGVLAMAHVYKRKPAVSMLVVAVEGKFFKKATGSTHFICNEGAAIQQTIETAIATSDPQAILVNSSGYNEAGELVATFTVTWSFKKRSPSIAS